MRINKLDLIKFKKWLNENENKISNFYVLVGPPAVGKSTWIKNTFQGKTKGVDYEVISKDDEIEDLFSTTQLSNKQLYHTKPEDDITHPEYGEVIKYNFRDKERKQYKKIYDTNNEINSRINNKIKSALSKKIDIVIDAINKNEIERQQVLKNVADNSNYKKIAVYFSFPSIADLEKRAKKRADLLRKKYGDKFDRSVSRGEYEDITSKITTPSTSEGFDEVISSEFKDDNMKSEITAETLTLNFRQFLNKETLLEATIRELISSHGIPKSFAKHVKSKCSNGNSNFILKVFMKNYKNMVESMTSEAASEKDKMLSDNYIMEFDRFMGHAGKTLDEYLKKHKGKKHRQEILELCEQGWPKFLKKMREYKKSLQESLNEVRLNKTWKKRIKQRAKRNERDITPEDKKWAKKRLKQLNKESPELEEAYLKEIEAAMEATKASNVYLEKLRALRRKKLDDSKAMVKPTPSQLDKREKPGHRPTADERKPNEKIRGKKFAPPLKVNW